MDADSFVQLESEIAALKRLLDRMDGDLLMEIVSRGRS